MFDSVYAEIHGYIQAGGAWIMWPLTATAALLWYAIGSRWAILRRGSNKSVRVLINKALREPNRREPRGIIDAAIERGIALRAQGKPHLRRYLDDAFAEYTTEIRRWRTLITTLVALSPLMGLLGTVVGMIETFKSLGDMSLFSQSGGIAGGISTALFTTQMGLAVAIPGFFLKGVLDRREHEIDLDLAQIKDILVAPTPAHENRP